LNLGPECVYHQTMCTSFLVCQYRRYQLLLYNECS
jgi:hypothetical protein